MKHPKICSKEEIKGIIENLREKNDEITIVTTNGSFDIIHAGHVKSLEFAKEQGDVLIVGLNSDHSVRQYKSPDRPMIPEHERAYMLGSLECVDYIVIFDELTSNTFVENIRPDVHVKSRSGYDGTEQESVEKNGGVIVLFDDIPGISTTKLIEKVLKVYGKKEE